MEFSDEIRYIVPALDLNIEVRKDKKAGRVMTTPWFSHRGSCLLPPTREGAREHVGVWVAMTMEGGLWPFTDRTRDALSVQRRPSAQNSASSSC